MVKLLTANPGSVAWQKKISATDPANDKAISARDVKLLGDNAYFAFMYVGDCLIVVLNSAGVEIMQRQFGVGGEIDILAALVFTSSGLFIYGSFTGTTYQAGANPSHFIYQTQADFATGPFCTQLPI